MNVVYNDFRKTLIQHFGRSRAEKIWSDARKKLKKLEVDFPDILSCPLHDAAIKIGLPEVAQVVCAMDKAYMCGFKYIEYTRSTSVAEGHACCDYRLRFDKNKR